MSKNTTLATISDSAGNHIQKITVGKYEEFLVDRNQAAIAEMIYHRFNGRYIKPFMFADERYKKFYKNGFVMMASACLLIETLEAFQNGWEKTPRDDEGGANLFERFFKRETAFNDFLSKKFYTHVRCGLLHQGETTGGFTIGRESAEPLLNNKKRINAHMFLMQLEKALRSYTGRLSKDEWDSEIWDNFRRKMRFIIKHCKS